MAWICPHTGSWNSLTQQTFPFIPRPTVRLCSSQPNACNYKCFLIRNTEIGNHALTNLFLPSHPHQSGIRCKISSLILASGPRPVSCSRAAQGRGAGSACVYHCCQATALWLYMAILSEAARLGPRQALILKRDPPAPPPLSSGPPQAPPLLL